jgi:hypothetical protein
LEHFPGGQGVVAAQSPGNAFGNFFSQQYQRVPDPACAAVAASLTSFCTLTALADRATGIYRASQLPRPASLGSLGLRPLEGPGSWDFDANIQKSVRIAESEKPDLQSRMHRT